MSTDQPAGEMSPVAPGKHLPSWALKFRQQVEAARVNIEATNKQISRVKASTEVLTGILKDTHAKFEARDKQNEEDKASKARDSRRLGEMRYFQLSKMLPDVFGEITSYLDKKDIAAIDCAAPVCRDLLLHSGFWSKEYLDYQSKRRKNLPTNVPVDKAEARQVVVAYYSRLARGCLFLKEMKEQRGRPKHRDVKPHVYCRSDKEVSHSLPLFEGTAPENERVMSKAQTFSNDFRSLALQSVREMMDLTADTDDVTVLRRLKSNSVVTVLISLLANESGAMQQMCCSVLGNLLAMEARQLPSYYKAAAAESWTHTHEEYGTLTRAVDRELALQMRRCDGAKVLMGLLTSPTATINLAAGQSSSVQGMCNQQAARALCNLFCPSMPILKDSTLLNSGGYPVSKFLLSEWPRKRAWRFAHYNKKGSLRETYLAYLAISPDLHVHGRGSDDMGFFVMSGKAEKTIDSWMWLLHKTYIDNSEMFTSDDLPVDEGAPGQSDIGSQGDNEESGYRLQERIQSWLVEEPHEDSNALQEMQMGSALRAHQSMLCYWRSADGEGEGEGEGEDMGAYSGEELSRESFFGVVEMAQKDSHFYLDQLKGGVVRAAAVNLEAARW